MQLEASRTQKFIIRDVIDTATLLPVPRVENGGSDEIDPGNYTNGLPVAIDAYSQRAVGDHMVLAWMVPSGEAHVQVFRLDQSSLMAKQFVLRIEHKWLVASLGAVQVFYQYGREGRSLTSKVLSLNVTTPRVTPPMPTIRRSTQKGKSQMNSVSMPTISGTVVHTSSSPTKPTFARVRNLKCIGRASRTLVGWSLQPRVLKVHGYSTCQQNISRPIWEQHHRSDLTCFTESLTSTQAISWTANR